MSIKLEEFRFLVGDDGLKRGILCFSVLNGKLMKSQIIYFLIYAATSLVICGDVKANTFALTISNSVSYDRSLSKLRYTNQDSMRMRLALETLSDVKPENSYYLNDLSLEQFRKDIRQFSRNVSKIDGAKVFIYFSGHADLNGLHFRDGFLSKDEFHILIKGIKAKSKIVFLDSCYSGALVSKGIENNHHPNAQSKKPLSS